MAGWEDEAPVSTGEEVKDIMAQAEAMAQAAPMVPVVQRRTAFQTAVSVIRPRNLKAVEQEVMMEADSAGEDFFYAIPFKKRDGSEEIVSDGSIDLAYAMMRAMGNCGITTDVNDVVAPDGHHWEFKSIFIDLEKGANYERTVRRMSGAGTLGKLAAKDPQRVYDMRFGAAQSISQRNAIKAGVPGWMWDRAVKRARDAAVNNIKRETPAIAIEKAVKHFAGMGVTVERLEKAVGRAKDVWTPDDILKLRGYATALKDGMSNVEGIFGRKEAPPVETEKTGTSEAMPPETPPETAKKGGRKGKAEKAELPPPPPTTTTGEEANVPPRSSEDFSGTIQGGDEPPPGEGSGEAPPETEDGANRLTFGGFLDAIKLDPKKFIPPGTLIISAQGDAVLAKVEKVSFVNDQPQAHLKFVDNLAEISNGLTVVDVVTRFRAAGVTVFDVDAPILTPPNTQETGKKWGRPKASEVREECRNLMTAKGIGWDKVKTYFPGESLEELPDAKLTGLLDFLKSRD